MAPCSALLKDQVDGLARRTGMHKAAALSGLLTSPERGVVLRGIRTGSIALLYVSPEQLRSSAVKNALRQREIGCWVLNEAHCLSKWGHDFRPDYLYVGRADPHSHLYRVSQWGSTLNMKLQGERIQLVTPTGCAVAQLSAAATQTWKERLDAVEAVRVVCSLVRRATDCKDPEFQTQLN